MNDVPNFRGGFASAHAPWPEADWFTGQTGRIHTRLDQNFFAAALHRAVARRRASRPCSCWFATPSSDVPLANAEAQGEAFFEYHDFSEYPNPEAASRGWIEERLRQSLVPDDVSAIHFAVAKLGEGDFVWARACHHGAFMPNSAANSA